jgi:hypothetical protein
MSKTIPEQDEEEEDLTNTECDLFVNSGVKCLTVLLLLVLLTQILLTLSIQQVNVNTSTSQSAYLGVAIGCFLGLISYATNIFGFLSKNPQNTQTNDIFEHFSAFIKESEEHENNWFKVLLYHAVVCSFLLSIMFLIQLYDRTIDFTPMCFAVAPFATYALLAIVMVFVKPLTLSNSFIELAKHMNSPTEKAFYDLCNSSPAL